MLFDPSVCAIFLSPLNTKFDFAQVSSDGLMQYQVNGISEA